MGYGILPSLHLGAFLALVTLTTSAPVDGENATSPNFSTEIESSIEEARRLMGSVEYEEAIAILEPALEMGTSDIDQLREMYLLLIEAHVYRGSFSPAGTKEQRLWYDEARSLIVECLSVPALRRTLPDPPERYPQEMLRLFGDVRREIFGSFRIEEIEPADAEVVFDGEVLAPGEDGTWSETDVPVGTHTLLVRHESYQDITEDVEVSPATVVTRSYALDKNKGFGWYATRIVVPVAVVAGLAVAVLTDDPPPDEPPAPLPGPPGLPDE